MITDVIHYGLVAALAIALLIAAFTDIKRRQIDNSLNAAIACAAPLYWWSSGLALWPEIAMQVGFAFAVIVVLLVLYYFRTMGGGDVKLLAALALWVPPSGFFTLIIVMALAGGVLTIIMAVYHAAKKQREKLAIPYGVAIACGGLWVLASSFSLGLPAIASIG